MKPKKAAGITLFVLLFLLLAALLSFLIIGFYGSGDGQSQVVSGKESDRSDQTLSKGSIVVYTAESRDGTPVTESGMERMLEIMRKCLVNVGYIDAQIRLSDGNKLIVDLPSVDDPSEVMDEFAQTANLEFRIHGQDKPILTGDDVATAATFALNTGEAGEFVYVVDLTFTDEGTASFAEATKYCAQNSLTLDIYVDGVVISSPSISSEYASSGITSGKATISGDFTPDSAIALANNINAGILPYTLTVDRILSSSIK